MATTPKKRRRMTQRQANELIAHIAVLSLNLLVRAKIINPLAVILAQCGRLDELAVMLEKKLEELGEVDNGEATPDGSEDPGDSPQDVR